MNLSFMRALDEEERIKDIVEKLGFGHINTEQVKCVFSRNSSSRALGRIWSTPRIFSFAFNSSPKYVIELLHSKYMRLSDEEKVKVLIHELLHIPKTFSGALKPHVEMGKTISCGVLDSLYKKYLNG